MPSRRQFRGEPRGRLPIALLGVGVLFIVAVIIALPAMQTRMQGVQGECAEEFEEYKTALRGHHWQWLPYPSWVCEFDSMPERGIDAPFEKRLPG